MQTVYVGMSGGVDSSVSALLLLEQGYRVVGVYMKNWSEDLPGMKCPWAEDLADAKRVAVKLGIDFEVWDFEKEYREKVVEYMLAEFRAGNTPNPDIMCNQEIKFKLFYEKAREAGADFIATGHYARVGQFECIPSGTGRLGPSSRASRPHVSVVTSEMPRKADSQLPSEKQILDTQMPQKAGAQLLQKKQVLDAQMTRKASAQLSPQSFDFGGLLKKIEDLNEVVYQQLGKCRYEVQDGVLHLYPKNKIVKNILEKPNNKKILVNTVGDLKIEIHTEKERPKSATKDATLSKISDIMGGEVLNDNGGNSPF